MIVFIVLNAGEGTYSRRIASAVERNGKQTRMLSWRHFDYALISQLDPDRDAIFFRTGAGPAVRIARAFEDAGFHVINDSRYIQLSGQKHLANVHAGANGIAIPDVNVTIRKDNAELMSLYLKQNGALVAKPIVSRDMGRYVFLVKTEADFADVASIPGSHILLQSEVKFDRLVRTIVTADGMLAEATTYDTTRETWKATVCENPLAQHYRHVPKELIVIAEKTIKVFGGDVAYIDYFETPNGFVLNEINHSCGLIEHERISGYPIAESIGEFLAHFQDPPV
jgi:[lysine-biosynthesis-protein LysW]--L-2-aminoadipate ligase